MMVTAELRETTFDPLFAGQAMFRKLLEATARPGLVVPLGEMALAVPPPRLRPACALLLALMDREVGFCVVGSGGDRVREYLRFNTGASVTDLGAADFVLVAASGSTWSGAHPGTLEAPHAAATVVLAPLSLSCAPAAADVTLRLKGPGIAGESRLDIQGLTASDVQPICERSDFPTGVDVWLAAADGHLAVIPRSTRCWLAE
jgi:alpha-D-ribose 1-methylphosphonate 5-triphosphate synthase subunit PhnH